MDNNEKKNEGTDVVKGGFHWRFSVSVWYIVIAKVLQIFAFCLQSATLTIFITQFLHYSPSTATATYHGAAVVVFTAPLLSGVLADAWIGRYRVILLFTLLQLIGMSLYTILASPLVRKGKLVGIIITLLLGCVGSGGHKPIMGSFGADQFPENEQHLNSFFSVYYMGANLGALSAFIAGPLLTGIKCFKPADDPTCSRQQCPCYVLIYGIASLSLVLAIVVILLGSKRYVKIKPVDSIATKFAAAIISAIKNKITKKKSNRIVTHWLDYASENFDDELLSNFKRVLSILWLFMPLSIYWSLYTQTGSTWVIQGTQMKAKLGKVTISEDILQSVNPFLIIVLAPIFDSFVYPLLARCGLLKTLIQRIVAGMLILAIAFVITGILQVLILRNPIESHDTDLFPLNQTTLCPNMTSCLTTSMLRNGTTSAKQEEHKPFKSTIHIMWQIIPYFLLSCSETIYMISGLHFSYAEAPKSMAAMISSFYFLTIALGNIFTLIVNAIIGEDNVAPWVFFLYVGFMVVATIAFLLMARSYSANKTRSASTNVQNDYVQLCDL